MTNRNNAIYFWKQNLSRSCADHEIVPFCLFKEFDPGGLHKGTWEGVKKAAEMKELSEQRNSLSFIYGKMTK